jgi:hypothetical protein
MYNHILVNIYTEKWCHEIEKMIESIIGKTWKYIIINWLNVYVCIWGWIQQNTLD